jgi:hypothetical protein
MLATATSLLLAFVIVGLDYAPSIAQRTLVITTAPECGSCAIRITRIATISDDGGTSIGEGLMLSQNSRGYLFATDISMWPGEVRVFDPTGRYVRRFGRDGEGPGEYRQMPPPLFGTNDSMLVIDYGLRRITTLTQEGTVAAIHRLPGLPYRLVPTRSGFVYNGTVADRGAAGWPLVHITRGGRITGSFGADQPGLDPMRPAAFRRVLARSGAEHVWSGRINRYVIEKWSVTGTRVLTIERVMEGCSPWEEYSGPATVVRPPCTVHAIWEDDQRRLWVVLHVPDLHWKRTNFAAKPGDMIRMPRADNNALYDTIIDIIDVEAGIVLASQRLKELFQTVGDGQPFVTYHEDQHGKPIYHVWRTSMER